ncbi:MAG TPA: efflux RND transporter permease subunit, partial [Gemmatimonadales bacterium]|nr:efflux RND transporter permease subunit [Gemmatimonadales bacterium]
MKLSDTAIRRPVLATMLSVALVLFGVLGYRELSVREFPDVDPPIISVSTTLRGANPRVMESAVTDVLEEELSSVEGLRTMTSSSAEQSSNITLEFQLDRDVEAAAQDVRDKVSRVRGRLPEEIEEPVVSKQDADARPVMFISLTSETHDLMQLTDLANRIVKKRLQTIPGVARADLRGERRYSMRVWLSASALASRGLTVQDAMEAIRSRNVEVPAGRIESSRREFTVRSLGELKTPAEFSDLVISAPGNQIVRLRDVGNVELGPENDRSVFRTNGRPSIGVTIQRQSKANLVEIANHVRAAIPEFQAMLPAGVRAELGYDQSVYVIRSIKEAQETLVIAAGLVVLIIFLFLRNYRATIIPGLAIPASIIGTFAIMAALGFSINNLTLLALTLAIGIVVDDAIIVLENAYRHQEELGKSPEQAAIDGSNEIGFAVIATTIALIAVFTPLAFLKGATGRLFNEFGIAVAGSVLISGFVALTLTPMLCAKILRVPKTHGRMFQALEAAFDGLANGYKRLLGSAVRHRVVVVVAVLLITIGAGFTFTTLKREFVPSEDRGSFMISIIAPEGSTIAYTDEYQRQAERIMLDTPEITMFNSVVGRGNQVNGGYLFTRLKDWSDRKRTAQDIIKAVQPRLSQIPGVMAFANNPPAFGGYGQPVQFVVRHPDFDQLAQAMDTLVKRARQVPGVMNVDSDMRINKPELTVSFDRNRAEDLGVPVRDVATALQALLGGQRASTFTRDNELYDVIVQLAPEARATPSDMAGIQLRGRNGQLVQLDAIARVNEGAGPRQLSHYDRVRSSTLSASVAPGFTLGEVIDSLRALGNEVLPSGSSVRLSGESRELEESGGALYFAFILALGVVFMVLASQFESMVHPFTVLLAVPLAVSGAIFTLKLTGSTLNLYSQIGMILLIGLVAKNSILLVEYSNQLRERGMSAVDAVLESGRIRLRPILMTSVATVMGALPIALGLGAGSMSRKPLGYAIVGGVLFSTVLTLFLVPVAYVLLDRLQRRGTFAPTTESEIAD